ncbi:MAG: Signal peptidase I [Ignavibacteriae bacterium]|nr:MAG: Signal peptidase I [Ignavibacteriota bacterium]
MKEWKKKIIKLKDILQITFIVILLAYLLKMFFLDTLKIPSSSMEKTLLPGDFVVVNKFYYNLKIPNYIPLTNIEIKPTKILSFSKPKKGDVVAFYLYNFDGKDSNPMTFVKRCVAGPGDSIKINNTQYCLPEEGDHIYVDKTNINDLKPLILRDGNKVEIRSDSLIYINDKPVNHYKFQNDFYYFVGDNVTNSVDSRNFGPIPEKDIIGKVVLVYWSLNMDNMVKSFIHKIRWNRLGMLVW